MIYKKCSLSLINLQQLFYIKTNNNSFRYLNISFSPLRNDSIFGFLIQIVQADISVFLNNIWNNKHTLYLKERHHLAEKAV